MLQSHRTIRFRKNVEVCIKRGYDMSLLKNVMRALATQQTLPKRCRPHKLRGEFTGCWECHIKGDWLLIYRYDFQKQQIFFEDTGTHSDLF